MGSLTAVQGDATLRVNLKMKSTMNTTRKPYPKRCPKDATPLERLELRIQRQQLNPDTTECWIWPGGLTDGYGIITINNKKHMTHRLMYTEKKGEIPANMELDHLCRQRACCNPDHLEAVSHRTNILRGNSFIHKQTQQTHCLRGHEFTAENTYLKRKSRCCRECAKLHSRKYK